jgi:hypothetical protein
MNVIAFINSKGGVESATDNKQIGTATIMFSYFMIISLKHPP